MDQMMNHDTLKSNAHQSEAVAQVITNPYVLNDYEQQIVTLWNKGFSASVIATQLGKNRNIIIGKVWRMRQKGIDIKEHERPTGQLRVKKEPKVRIKKLASLPLFDFKPPKPLPEIKQSNEAKPLNVSFGELKNNSCRYVVNNGRPENFIFCGALKERGSYCEAHALICYIPSKPPARKQHNPIAQQRYYR